MARVWAPTALAPGRPRINHKGRGLSWFVACWVALAATVVPLGAFAQPSMQTILTNGPTSNRLNIVVLSEGYTSSELGQFVLNASNAVRVLLSHPPYREYSNYVNGFAIKVASSQSGCDHPSRGIYKNTYFSSFCDASETLLTIPADSTGQGKVDALLTNFMPRCHLPVMLVNDPTIWAGSDGFNQTAIASTNAVAYEAGSGQPGILSHEVGHVLANLGDEYTTPYPGGFPDTEEPNTTQETNRLLIKWRAWISTNTPIPTLEYVGEGVVGLYPGAHYQTDGWYRPEYNCAMGSPGVAFCHVCSEALVLAIYQKVRPVDAFSPASTNLTLTNTQPLNFSLALLHPATHDLSVQWFTNGMACTGATNSAFTLFPQSLPNGSNWVAAVVRDNTPLVRTDPTNLLTQTVTWGLNVSVPQLRLDSPLWLPGGKFAFRVRGHAPQGFSIRGGTNLTSWVPLSTNALVAGQFWYTNTAAGNFRRQFFRAVTPP
jgi:hypothetical protein